MNGMVSDILGNFWRRDLFFYFVNVTFEMLKGMEIWEKRDGYGVGEMVVGNGMSIGSWDWR